WTSRPSNRIWPLSKACVPATHLISVDFPAPLSPTRAMTSPGRTSKSTPFSACTEPNDFVMSRSSRTGGVSLIRQSALEAPLGAPPTRYSRVLLAVLRVGADADVALLQELVREEPLVVGLRD